MKKILLLATLIVLSSCNDKAPPSIDPTPVKSASPMVSQSSSVMVLTGSIQDQIDQVVDAKVESYANLIKFNSSKKYWKAVIKGIASAESNFNVTETYWEKTLGKNGIDPVNGSKYLSEGLLQLSYSDKQAYGCDFDWAIDKSKAEKDKTKMIFDVEKNVTCGMIILNKLVKIHGDIIYNSGNYWAVLMPKNKRHAEYLAAFKKYNK